MLRKVFAMVMVVCFFTACQILPVDRARDAVVGEGEFSPFISVEGSQFMRAGRPYYFVGTNFWYGAYLGSTIAGRARLVSELDLLDSLGIRNLRILAISESTSLTKAVRPGIQTTPGVLDEELLKGLDVLLDEMAKRDMLAVLYLNNYWQWSGGMAQYMSWVTGEAPFDPDTTGDWNGFMQNSAKFYRSDRAQEWYRDVIRQIVQRTNSVNGTRYFDDPAIMSWQLANEPRPGSDADGHPYFEHYKSWLQATAQYIKSLDANHLVSTGSEGSMGALRDISLYIEAHDVPEVDYLTFHLWPKNWSWLDIRQPEKTYGFAQVKAKSYILEHIEVAKQLNKPTVLEEFGVERDGGAFATTATTKIRDDFYRAIFQLIEQQAKLGAPIAGTNFWTWGGYGFAKHEDFMWREGDPFTGDPPQEAQGLNSVFADDRSTLQILRDHASVMNDL